MRLGMYDNEGNIALARKLNELLNAMPKDAYNADLRFIFAKEALLADSNFCTKHPEWQDTAVRDVILSWAESQKKINISDERATVSVQFHFPVEVTTLNGDARAVLDDKGDEIHEIVEDAVKYALAEIEKRVGHIAGEWSGVQIQFA
jgi:hypothetical protein